MKLLTRKAVNFMLEKMNNEDGFSINEDLEEPESGYMVSLPGDEWIKSSVTKNVLKAFLTAKKAKLKLDAIYAGCWVDQQSKRTFLDLSINVRSLDEAKKLAK